MRLADVQFVLLGFGMGKVKNIGMILLILTTVMMVAMVVNNNWLWLVMDFVVIFTCGVCGLILMRNK